MEHEQRTIGKFGEIIHAQLDEILLKREDVDLPADALVTITAVVPRDDLQVVDVYVSVLPAARAIGVLARLNRARKRLNWALGRAIRRRRGPELHFKLAAE